MQEACHPFCDCDLNKALTIARDLIHSPAVAPANAPLPSIEQAKAAIAGALAGVSFKWKDGRAALQVLRVASGEPESIYTR